MDLYNRFSFYFSCKAMENSLQKSKSYIYNALLKYGHSNFELTILEYCEPEQCLEREDYYLCSLPHEYNILSKAGSRLDSKCSDKTKQIMSDAHKGKTLSDDTKKKNLLCVLFLFLRVETKKVDRREASYV